MPVDYITVGSSVSVCCASLGTSLSNVSVAHVYSLEGESRAMECIVLSDFICFIFHKTYTVIPYL